MEPVDKRNGNAGSDCRTVQSSRNSQIKRNKTHSNSIRRNKNQGGSVSGLSDPRLLVNIFKRTQMAKKKISDRAKWILWLVKLSTIKDGDRIKAFFLPLLKTRYFKHHGKDKTDSFGGGGDVSILRSLCSRGLIKHVDTSMSNHAYIITDAGNEIDLSEFTV